MKFAFLSKLLSQPDSEECQLHMRVKWFVDIRTGLINLSKENN